MINLKLQSLIPTKVFCLIVYSLTHYSCTQNTDGVLHAHTNASPTDSSGIYFHTSERLPLGNIPVYSFEGEWILSDSSIWAFEGRKLHQHKGNQTQQTVFARYNLPPQKGGLYDSLGEFLVIGSGADSLICYKIVLLNTDSLIVQQEETTPLLVFTKNK